MAGDPEQPETEITQPTQPAHAAPAQARRSTKSLSDSLVTGSLRPVEPALGLLLSTLL